MYRIFSVVFLELKMRKFIWGNLVGASCFVGTSAGGSLRLSVICHNLNRFFVAFVLLIVSIDFMYTFYDEFFRIVGLDRAGLETVQNEATSERHSAILPDKKRRHRDGHQHALTGRKPLLATHSGRQPQF
jgi:hypothetical protein